MKNRQGPVLCHWVWVLILLLTLVNNAIAQVPQYAETRLKPGIDLYSQGKWREAVLELRRVQAEVPNKELRAEALFWIGVSELSAGEYLEALRAMEDLVKTDPKNPRVAELPYHRGRALYYLGSYDEAIVNFKVYSDSITAGTGAGLNAADSYRKAAALYWMGESLYSMGQMDRASDVFTLVTEEYPGSPKYEASIYRLSLIKQKKVEGELLGLLKWSHEESLRNMEEYHRRESSYDQAMGAYQKRIDDMLKDTRLSDLERENEAYREQLKFAEDRILSLETALGETSSAPEEARSSSSLERLKILKSSAQELESRIGGPDRNSGGEATGDEVTGGVGR